MKRAFIISSELGQQFVTHICSMECWSLHWWRSSPEAVGSNMSKNRGYGQNFAWLITLDKCSKHEIYYSRVKYMYIALSVDHLYNIHTAVNRTDRHLGATSVGCFTSRWIAVMRTIPGNILTTRLKPIINTYRRCHYRETTFLAKTHSVTM